jgi:hypothetical protein
MSRDTNVPELSGEARSTRASDMPGDLARSLDQFAAEPPTSMASTSRPRGGARVNKASSTTYRAKRLTGTVLTGGTTIYDEGLPRPVTHALASASITPWDN